MTRRWGRKVPYYFPALCTQAAVDNLCPGKERLKLPLTTLYPEKFSVSGLADYVDNSIRKANQQCLLAHLKLVRSAGNEKGGRQCAGAAERARRWLELETKIVFAEESALALREKLTGTEGSLQTSYHSCL